MMSQTYTTRRRTEKPAPPQTAAVPAAQAPLQSAFSQSLTGGGGAQLDQIMQARIQEHFLNSQIPQAEQEADQLAAQVKDARTPEEVKNQLGEKMGADFSNVRFHTGAEAEQKAEGIGARAYTTGRDVYFGEGGFDPAVAAHELVHTTQQGVVDSGVSTVAAPAGGVQMMPKFFSKIGGFFKRLFRSKDQKNQDMLSETTVPSRAGEQEAHRAFTQDQIDNMENTANGVRSDKTIEERIDPVTAPMKAEMGDYFDSLDQQGFDYGRANQGVQEYKPSEEGLTKFKFNKSSVAATKKLLGMFGAHLDRPEMQAMLRDMYGHEMANPEKKTAAATTHEGMESRFIKNVMSKGLIPVGSQIRGAVASGNNAKVDFLRTMQTNTAYLESMNDHMDNDDIPEEIRDLMGAYGPIRAKLLAAARGGR